MPVIALRAVVPKSAFNTQAALAEINAALFEEGRELDSLYRQFYSPWRTAKPTMRKRFKLATLGGRIAWVKVATEGDTKGNRKLLYLDDGTSERWAIMSNPYTPGTAKGRIRSRTARGHAVRRGRKAMRRPQKGIAARNVTKSIVRIRQPRFISRMDRAMARTADRF